MQNKVIDWDQLGTEFTWNDFKFHHSHIAVSLILPANVITTEFHGSTALRKFQVTYSKIQTQTCSMFHTPAWVDSWELLA